VALPRWFEALNRDSFGNTSPAWASYVAPRNDQFAHEKATRNEICGCCVPKLAIAKRSTRFSCEASAFATRWEDILQGVYTGFVLKIAPPKSRRLEAVRAGM